jgi:hypothetical protein
MIKEISKCVLLILHKNIQTRAILQINLALCYDFLGCFALNFNHSDRIQAPFVASNQPELPNTF